MTQRRRIGALGAALHIGELITQRTDAECMQLVRERCHGGMRHAGACAMAEYQQCASVRGRKIQPIDAVRVIDVKGQRDRFGSAHAGRLSGLRVRISLWHAHGSSL